MTRTLRSAFIAVLSGSACLVPVASIDGGEGPTLDAGRRDAGGPTVLPPEIIDSSWPETSAGERCPAESFGRSEDDGGTSEVPDGSVIFGVCGVTRTLTGQATLNQLPVAGPVRIRWVAGNFESEIERQPDGLGQYSVRVLRSRYDLLQYEPTGIFATHRGFRDFGTIDMTRDQQRSLAVKSHALRGTALFGGLPFVASTSPDDIAFGAFGTPQQQTVSVSSQAGAYELKLMEGVFSVFLTSPSQALYGTELRTFPLVTSNIELDRDRPLDIDITTRLLEGELTIDGQPLPDRIAGKPDFTLDFVRPGDPEPSVRTNHEGGSASFSGLVPAGRYSVLLNLEESSDAVLPAIATNQQIAQNIDLTQNDGRVTANFTTFRVEGGILLDGQPLPSNPASSWKLYFYGFAGTTTSQSWLMYKVPMTSASFTLRIFPGNYFTFLRIGPTVSPDMAEGVYMVDRFFQVQGDRQLPINIETAMLTGKLLIDGKPPPAGQVAGQFRFRNRALQNQFSWYTRAVICAADGEFRVRLPTGQYEVQFVIDRNTYPEYATGTVVLASLVNLYQPVALDLLYDTVHVTGPMRLDKQLVPDAVTGEEVGLLLRRDDNEIFEWGFNGGRATYDLRVPKGIYDVDYVVNPRMLDGVAWGNAPLGAKLRALPPGE